MFKRQKEVAIESMDIWSVKSVQIKKKEEA